MGWSFANAEGYLNSVGPERGFTLALTADIAAPLLGSDYNLYVFGYNATVPYKISPEEVKLRRSADKITRARTAYRDQRDPNYLTYGPKTRREFFNLLRHGPA